MAEANVTQQLNGQPEIVEGDTAAPNSVPLAPVGTVPQLEVVGGLEADLQHKDPITGDGGLSLPQEEPLQPVKPDANGDIVGGLEDPDAIPTEDAPTSSDLHDQVYNVIRRLTPYDRYRATAPEAFRIEELMQQDIPVEKIFEEHPELKEWFERVSSNRYVK